MSRDPLSFDCHARRTGRLISRGAQSLSPLLAAFAVSMGIIVFYCGGNLSRGWAWLGGSPLAMGSGPSAQVQARAQSEAPVAGQPSQIPAGYTVLADHHPLGVCDRLGYPAEPPSPVGRRINRVVDLVAMVVVAILAAIVVSRISFIATPGQTSRAGRPFARVGRSIDRPGPECSRCPAPARRTRGSALAPLSARPLR